MRVVFLSNRHLRLALVILVLVLVFTGLAWWRGQAVNTWKEVPIYQGNPEVKAVALAINVDWGEEYLPAMLAALQTGEANATFFITGRWASKNQELAHLIDTSGHEVGSHGYSHPHVQQLSEWENLEELKQAENIIQQVTGKKPGVYAPPYGELGPQVIAAAKQMGYRTIMWTVDTIDWNQNTSVEDIKMRVRDKVQNGAIILMHPTGNTVQALPEIITMLKEKGYGFRTVTDLLAP